MTAAKDDLRSAIPGERAERGVPSTAKYRGVDQFFAEMLNVPVDVVYTTGISKPGNVKVRATQSTRANHSHYLVLIIEDAADPSAFSGSVAAAAQLVGPGQKRAAILVGETNGIANEWEVLAVVEPVGGAVVNRLQAEWPSAERVDPAPTKAVGPGPTLAVPLTMDESTSRMARLAVASSPAVLFVGPPGTGKNRLLNEILSEIDADPSSYGLTKTRDVVVEPAEEGWTTRDLVGGDTIDEDRQAIRFRPGKVLDAIANDRWLVIDEANRADLDRIFGGLLTWLSRQEVVVGRASTKVGAPLVQLGWSEEHSSQAVGAERLAQDDVGHEPIRYLAGTEFRLLGTYNALDAQRVFRFGLALGRRFAQVPVPPARVDDFVIMLESTASDIADDDVRSLVVSRVVSMYRAHHATTFAQLGPAMFLGIPEYVAKGLELADLVNVDPESEEDLLGLINEAYLLATGSWLARLDEHSELPGLGQHLTIPADDGSGNSTVAMSVADWEWVASQLPTIGG